MLWARRGELMPALPLHKHEQTRCEVLELSRVALLSRVRSCF